MKKIEVPESSEEPPEEDQDILGEAGFDLLGEAFGLAVEKTLGKGAADFLPYAQVGWELISEGIFGVYKGFKEDAKKNTSGHI